MTPDPRYVRGGAGCIETCGNPPCEAGAFLACRERILAAAPSALPIPRRLPGPR